MPELNDELVFEQYKICVEEYRFQVELNWKRSQYYFVLNAAILVAGVGLLNSSSKIPVGVTTALFGLGALVAFLATFATATQLAYYEASRDQMKHLSGKVGLGDLALKTTPSMGAQIKRFGKVKTFQYLILLAIAAADVAGFVVSITSQ